MSTETDGNTPQGNQSSFYGQKVSIPGIDVNSAGDNQLILKDDYSSRIYYNDQGVPTVLLGLRPNTTPSQRGLYVSQDGVDVTTASDNQLIFNTSQDIFKIAVPPITVPLTLTLATSGVSFGLNEVAHNLPYIPAYLAFITLDSQFEPLLSISATNGPNPYIVFGDSPSTLIPELIAQVGVDDTNITFTLQTTVHGSPSVVNNFAKVYLLQETAT